MLISTFKSLQYTSWLQAQGFLCWLFKFVLWNIAYFNSSVLFKSWHNLRCNSGWNTAHVKALSWGAGIACRQWGFENLPFTSVDMENLIANRCLFTRPEVTEQQCHSFVVMLVSNWGIECTEKKEDDCEQPELFIMRGAVMEIGRGKGRQKVGVTELVGERGRAEVRQREASCWLGLRPPVPAGQTGARPGAVTKHVGKHPSHFNYRILLLHKSLSSSCTCVTLWSED